MSMKIVAVRVIAMVRQGPFHDQLFDFTAYHEKLAELRKEKKQAEKQAAPAAQVENVQRKTDINELMTNQLSILQDIQYSLNEMEKNTKKKRRWFFNKSEE